MADESRFAKGDLNSVMAAYPHVADWVRDFESRYGSRPMYYGPLDRDAKKNRPYNLIYMAKEPIFIHIYEPPEDDDGNEDNSFNLNYIFGYNLNSSAIF